MSGSAPQVTVTLDQATYRPGDPVTATATITDSDNTTETIHGSDELGRTVTATIIRADHADLLWRWQDGATAASGVNPFTLIAPTTTMSLECVASDAQGNQTIATVQVVVAVPQVMRVGVCVPASQRAAHARLFPGSAFGSSYSKPGAGLPSWKTLSAMPDVMPWVRFKDPVTPGLLTPWLDAMPADMRIRLTWRHEPRVTQDPAAYRAGWIQLRQLLDAHPAGARVDTCLILMSWQLRHEGQDWRAYCPTMPDGSWAAASIGVDSYVALKAIAYEPPESLFAEAKLIGAATGLPWYIPEMGALCVPGDTDGSGRAAWIASCLEWLRDNGCAGVAWWCSNDTDLGADFHLDTAPLEAAAWAKAQANQLAATR